LQPQKELLLGQVYRSLNEVYLRSELARKGQKSADSLESSISLLPSYADWIEKRYGPETRIEDPRGSRGLVVQHIGKFAAQAREQVSKPQQSHR